MATWISFRELRERISIYDVLERYGMLAQLKRQGDELVGLCPFHDDRRPSFSANTSKNVFQCFAGSCRKKGNVLDFVASKEGVDTRQAAMMLQEWSRIGSQSSPVTSRGGSQLPQNAGPPENVAVVVPEENQPLTFELKTLDPKHPYLQRRGLSEETIRTFGLGYCSRGLLRGRIAIPIHNERGELVAYAGRWPTMPSEEGSGEPPEDEPKYRLPRGFRKSLVVFNLHRAAKSAKKTGLILVEGYFGVIWLYQCRLPNVVALMGSSLSTAQKRLLSATLGPQGKLTLLLDEDESGRAGQRRCLDELSTEMFVKVASLPRGVSQPDQLSVNQVREIFPA